MSRVEAGVKEAVGSLIVNFGSYGKAIDIRIVPGGYDRLLQGVRRSGHEASVSESEAV